MTPQTLETAKALGTLGFMPYMDREGKELVHLPFRFHRKGMEPGIGEMIFDLNIGDCRKFPFYLANTLSHVWRLGVRDGLLGLLRENHIFDGDDIERLLEKLWSIMEVGDAILDEDGRMWMLVEFSPSGDTRWMVEDEDGGEQSLTAGRLKVDRFLRTGVWK